MRTKIDFTSGVLFWNMVAILKFNIFSEIQVLDVSQKKFIYILSHIHKVTHIVTNQLWLFADIIEYWVKQ
jgi:hypothetical protein